MKTIIAFAVFVVGISGIPNLSQQVNVKNERIVTDAIAGALQDLSQSIRDADLDPLYIKHESKYVALPVPVLFSASAFVEEFLMTGLSEIVINHLNLSVLSSRLTFDISLPRIDANLGKANLGVVLFGADCDVFASGRLTISDIRVTGSAVYRVGIISGISVRDLSIDFNIARIESALNVAVQRWDLSNILNTFLGTTIPNTLSKFSAEVNELIEIIALDIINDML